MKLSADTPIETILIHENYGAGVLRFNSSVEQQGADSFPSFPHRLVAVQFSNSTAWTYLNPDEEFAEMLPVLVHDLARA